MQVILAMPDRQETSAFLDTASKHGFVWRCLRQVQKPDLLTPVSIYQLVLGPKPSQDVLNLQVSPCPSSIPGTDRPVSAAAALASEAGQHDAGVITASQPSPLSNAGADEGAPGISSSAIAACSPGTLASPGQLPVQSSTGSSLASGASPGIVFSPPSMLGDDKPTALRTPSVQMSTKVLLVLDFDWSMIEENSDTFVVRELGGWESFQR